VTVPTSVQSTVLRVLSETVWRSPSRVAAKLELETAPRVLLGVLDRCVEHGWAERTGGQYRRTPAGTAVLTGQGGEA